MQQEGVQPDSVTFVGVLKACASMVAIEEVGVFIRTSFKAVRNLMSLRGVAELTCMQSVGAWRMLGKCSTRVFSENNVL
jgi:hypothetical protein